MVYPLQPILLPYLWANYNKFSCANLAPFCWGPAFPCKEDKGTKQPPYCCVCLNMMLSSFFTVIVSYLLQPFQAGTSWRQSSLIQADLRHAQVCHNGVPKFYSFVQPFRQGKAANAAFPSCFPKLLSQVNLIPTQEKEVGQGASVQVSPAQQFEEKPEPAVNSFTTAELLAPTGKVHTAAQKDCFVQYTSSRPSKKTC